MRLFPRLWTGLVILAAVALALPAQAQQVCDGVEAACSLEDLGSGRYRFTFVVTNGSPQSNVIFKWRVDPPHIPLEWVTVSFNVPPGWTGNHPDHHLDFQIPNGSYTTGRIYSPSVAAICGGASTLTFVWTFDNVGGPTPNCGDFGVLDYTYHMQGIDPVTCANLGPSFVCPGLLPVEEATWGAIKSVYRN